jgi:hypothetical protein
VNTAIYVRNRCPSKALSGKIPEELWEGKRINLSHLKVFGCEAAGSKEWEENICGI